MELFPSFAVFIKIGSVEIRWYAVCILLGALITYILSSKEAKEDKYDSEVMDDMFMGCLLCGIIGSRIWYCLFYDLSGYLSDPISILEIWDGGLAIQGGLLGGALFALIYCKIRHLQFLHLADIICPNILLAQAIGRWGNFFNQEAYGQVVSEKYFDGILSFLKQGMYIGFQYRQPMFFYESMLCVIGWVLIFCYKKYSKNHRGDGLFCYLSWYGAIRFWIETQRSDSLMIGNFKVAMIISAIFLMIGLAGLMGVFRKSIYKKKPVIVFDLDGTLLYTNEAIYRSFEHTFKQYKPELVLTDEDYASFLGPTLQQSFKKYIPEASDEDIEKMVETYRQYNRAIHKEVVKPMPHVPELLEYLKTNGYRFAIASSKTEEMVRFGLECTNLLDYFDTIIGVDDVINPKPDKETIVKAINEIHGSFTNAIYVGDSTGDIVAAKNTGCYAIGLTSNKLFVDKLKAEKPNEVIDDMIELEDILKQQHSWTYNLK